MSIKIHSFAGTAANVFETSTYLARADKIISPVYDRILNVINSIDYSTTDVAQIKGFLLAIVCYAMRKVNLPNEKQKYAYNAVISVLTKNKSSKEYTKEDRRADFLMASMGKGAFSYYIENGTQYLFSEYSLTKEIETLANYYYSGMEGQKLPCYFWPGDRKVLEQNPLLIGTALFVDDIICDALELTKTTIQGKEELVVENPLSFEELEEVINLLLIPIYNICYDLYGKYEFVSLFQSKDSFPVEWGRINEEANKIKVVDNKNVEIDISRIQENKNDVLYCRKCGNQIPVDSAFCKYCGTKVN